MEENENFNVSDFKSRFFKRVSEKSEFKNLVSAETSEEVNQPEDDEGEVSRIYFDEDLLGTWKEMHKQKGFKNFDV